jgi:hypothetical protein
MAFSPRDREMDPNSGPTTLECACGARLESGGEAELFEVAGRHASERHAGDPMYSELELRGAIGREREFQASSEDTAKERER